MQAAVFLGMMSGCAAKSLVQYDQQEHVPLEPNPSGGAQRVNVTGLMQLLRNTHANSFSWLLWTEDGSSYLDFVRVLSETANETIDGTPFQMWLTLIPPSEARGVPLRCSVPADSLLTPFNESELFNRSLGNDGCLDYAGWASVIGRVGAIWPHLHAVNIDDFSSNTATFQPPLLAAMRRNLAGAVALIPTFYYGRSRFIFTTAPWLANATDGVLFYFRNERLGQRACAPTSTALGAPAPTCSAVPTNCTMPCLSGTCAETTTRHAPSELADFAAALPSGHALHVGIYFAAYSHCTAPSVAYNRALLASVLALPSVRGATVYVTEPLPSGGAAACASGAAGADLDKGCVVRDVFGAWNATAEARAFDADCPPAFPFRTAGTKQQLCCGAVGDFAASCAAVGCCLTGAADECPPTLPPCRCPATTPYEYGGQVPGSGTFCCRTTVGFPLHCADDSECCLVPGANLTGGCQGRELCRPSADPIAMALEH